MIAVAGSELLQCRHIDQEMYLHIRGRRWVPRFQEPPGQGESVQEREQELEQGQELGQQQPGSGGQRRRTGKVRDCNHYKEYYF